MAGHRRAEATPFFERLCPAMTNFSTGADIATKHRYITPARHVRAFGVGLD
jgi:hypothetical protein